MKIRTILEGEAGFCSCKKKFEVGDKMVVLSKGEYGAPQDIYM